MPTASIATPAGSPPPLQAYRGPRDKDSLKTFVKDAAAEVTSETA